MRAAKLRSDRGLWLLVAGLVCCATLAAQVAARPRKTPAAQAGVAARALTVDRIYSFPSLSGRILRGAVWSPDGKWLTYLSAETDPGGPQVWAVDSDTGQRKVLVDNEHLRKILLPPASRGQTTGLGRLTPAQYVWSPDGKALLFISARELFWYDLATQSSRRLVSAPAPPKGGDSEDDAATIDDAKVSPDGRWASFLRAHDIWVVSASGGAPRQVTRGGTEERRNGELDWVYPEELDIATAYWWSPDSSKVAFLQLDESKVEKYSLPDELSPKGEVTEERYPVAGSPNPVARVGVVAAAGGDVRWMDTGTDRDALLARVAWLHDSRRVAIERLNRPQNRLDLVFADASTGKSQIALTEQDKYWINLADDLHFLDDNQRFLWSSERSGFRHLYLYDLSGKQIAQITRGNWQIDGVAGIDEKNGEVYFASSEANPIERQFYRVALSGGAEPQQLTHGHGTHHVDLAPNQAHFLDTYSNATTPSRQDLFRADGGTIATLTENRVAELADYRLQPVEFFTVPGGDGTRLQASLIKPANFDPARKYPVIVYVYGGPQEQSIRDAWEGPDLLWHEMMSQKGFVIFTVDNRGASGYGHAFETAIYHHFGQAELADQLAGVAWLAKQPYVDGSRIGIWGWSYGGYMTCMAMLRGHGAFKAGFAGAPVTDWKQYDTIYTERYMGTPQENPGGYHDSSPVNFAEGLEGKLLIAHATGDDNVHFANTVELAESLVNAQKYAEYQIYAGRGHGITDPEARIHIFNRVTQFFLDNLAN